MHTHTHIYIHTNIHTHIYIHTNIHTLIYTCNHTYTYIHITTKIIKLQNVKPKDINNKYY